MGDGQSAQRLIVRQNGVWSSDGTQQHSNAADEHNRTCQTGGKLEERRTEEIVPAQQKVVVPPFLAAGALVRRGEAQLEPKIEWDLDAPDASDGVLHSTQQIDLRLTI